MKKKIEYINAFFFYLSGSIYPILSTAILKQPFNYRYDLKIQFRNPWFLNCMVFIGMSILVIPYLVYNLTKGKSSLNRENSYNKDKIWRENLRLFRETFKPAILYIISNITQSYSLLFIPTSVWQIFIGFQLLFATLLTLKMKRTQLAITDWLGLLVIMSGICFGGVSTMLRGFSDDTTSIFQIFMAFLALIISNCLKAYVILLEEYLFKEYKAIHIQIGCFEGLWCAYLSIFIIIPIINILPKSWGVIFYENTIDTFYIINNNNETLLIMIVFYAICSIIYNFCGLVIIYYQNAEQRNLDEMLRPSFVWILSTIVYYITKNSYAGEKFDRYSVLEIISFALIIIGKLIYNKIIKISCFYRTTKTINIPTGYEKDEILSDDI